MRDFLFSINFFAEYMNAYMEKCYKLQTKRGCKEINFRNEI